MSKRAQPNSAGDKEVPAVRLGKFWVQSSEGKRMAIQLVVWDFWFVEIPRFGCHPWCLSVRMMEPLSSGNRKHAFGHPGSSCLRHWQSTIQARVRVEKAGFGQAHECRRRLAWLLEVWERGVHYWQGSSDCSPFLHGCQSADQKSWIFECCSLDSVAFGFLPSL